MKSCLRMALIQMPVSPSAGDTEKNLDVAESYLKSVAKAGANLAVLPEMFTCPYDSTLFARHAEEEGGLVYQRLSQMAAQYNLYLCAGSVPEREENRIYNTSYMFDNKGKKIAKHRKVHLFDIDIEGGQYFKESDSLSAGNVFTTFETEFCTMGLCICYDIRFPETTRIMADRGAQVILVPAAFNMTTGPVHWELLFRMRALENQLFIAGIAPARDEKSSYISYAHSIIANPWGETLVSLGEKEGYCIQEIDFALLEKYRKEFPLLEHRRKDLYCVTDMSKY